MRKRRRISEKKFGKRQGSRARKGRGVQVATENFSPRRRSRGRGGTAENERSGRERGARNERRLAEPGGEAPTTVKQADSALRRATSSPTRAPYVCRPRNKIAPTDRPTISRRRMLYLCSCIAVKVSHKWILYLATVTDRWITLRRSILGNARLVDLRGSMTPSPRDLRSFQGCELSFGLAPWKIFLWFFADFEASRVSVEISFPLAADERQERILFHVYRF